MSNSAEVLIMIGFVLPRSPATWRSIRAERSAAPSPGRRPSVERICRLIAGEVLRSASASATGPGAGSFACCSRMIASPSRTGRSIQVESPLSEASGGGSKGSRALSCEVPAVATAVAWPAADSGSAFTGSSSDRRPQAGSITASATKHIRPDTINGPRTA